MGQYDYQGTPASRMYDWLVTRNGDSLELCAPSSENYEIEMEDLEYIRGLVANDRDGRLPANMTQEEIVRDLGLIPTPEAEKPKPQGRVDYYNQVDPHTGKKKGIPEPLGPGPIVTRRHLNADGVWVDGDRPLYEDLSVEEKEALDA